MSCLPLALSETTKLVVSLVLFAVGLGLVGVEVFVPSGGAISVAAAALIIIAVIFGFSYSVVLGLVLVLCALVAVPLLVWYLFKVLPHTAIGKQLILNGPSDHEDVATAQERQLRHLVGKSGVVVGRLRPAGVALIDGRRYQVVSEGDMEEEGTKVRVVDVSGNRILVRVIREDENTHDLRKPSQNGEHSPSAG
ncbi:MAG: hypothetical protein DRP63_09425 [Planctomycetota bacterium]|nr:MAG: hypothetical protein DRP63_09425 [Planctomycetota bacterium]